MRRCRRSGMCLFFWVPMKHVNLDRFGAEELDEPTAELLKALHFSCTLSVWRVLK